MHAVFVARHFDSDTLFAFPPSLDALWSIMLGYELYDFLAEFLGGGTHWSIWVHHSIVVVGLVISLHFRQAAFYPLVFTMTEVTVVTANLHFWLKTLGLDKALHRVVLANDVARVALYWGLRLFLGPWVFWRGHSLGQLRPLFTQTAHWLIPFFVLFNVLALSGLNAFWTYKLTRNFLRSLRGARHKAD
jgi:hypothetical protein